ncbi:MAG: hypothetical protein HY329_27480 [Chloroflexi bacterium]|nr:hypothetical protein [Chloroflexota bacterium]
MIQRGLPSVVLVTERFTALAEATMAGRGIPNAPMVVVPGNPEWATPEEIRATTSNLIGELIEQVSQPAREPVEPPQA